MKTKLALLCYRVARWLAPALFDRPDSLDAIRRRLHVLRKEYEAMTAKQRNSAKGNYVLREVHDLQKIYRGVEAIGAQYEQVKVEIPFDASTHVLTVRDRKRLKDDPKLSTLEVIREDGKRLLFAAVVEGFANSKEIEKFLYFGKYPNGAQTIGIRLYLRHEDADSGARSQVGNYNIKPKKDEQ